MKSLKRQFLRIIAIAIPLSLLAVVVFAQEIKYVALSKEGQASISVDNDKKTAIIVDFGGEKSGKIPLIGEMDILHKNGIRTLIISCSHPHSDHMKGLTDFFQTVIDGKVQLPDTLNNVVVIDDDMPLSGKLFNLVKEAVAMYPKINLKYSSARNRNAYEGYSSPSDRLYVQTIPYVVADKKRQIHGRAVVTLFILDQKYSHLDFDDADQSVVLKVVEVLKKRGITEVDSFTAPHHGSASNDVGPIFSLKPKKVIFTVDQENRFGHPSAEVLYDSLIKLGKKNVLFTGSENALKIDSDGIKTPPHTAADRDSILFFLRPNMERLEKQRIGAKPKALARIAKSLELYEKSVTIMSEDDGNELTPNSSNNEPPSAPTSNSPGNATLMERIRLTGSLLSSEFDFGSVVLNEKNVIESLQTNKIFPVTTGDVPAISIEVPLDETKENNLSKIQKAKRDILLSGKNVGDNIKILPTAPNGFPDILSSPDLPINELSKTLPKGGMVYLNGGKLIPVGEATQLIGGKLDFCEDIRKFCIRADGTPNPYELPFSPSLLFTEVWTKMVDENVDSFYLSINPTKKMIEGLSSTIERVPTNKLLTEKDTSDQSLYLNRVVTYGNIAKSRIGEILWDADVMFKSKSLGFDVLGKNNNFSVISFDDLTKYSEAEEKADYISLLEKKLKKAAQSRRDRWCRLYWTNGDQRIVVDPRGKVVFEKHAVIARSEPMILVNGELQDYPKGTWCVEPKIVARALEDQANSTTNTNETLNDLKYLAEIQNFIVWTKNNGIEVTDKFKQEIERNKTKGSFEVPKWTSGIKSNLPPKPVVVQKEVTALRGVRTYNIHIKIENETEVETFKDCYKTLYGSREQFEQRVNNSQNGFTLLGKLNAEVELFVQSLSGCSTGVVRLKDKILFDKDTTVSSTTRSQRRSDNGILIETRTEDELISRIKRLVYIIDPAIEIHGGVMLGMQKDFLVKAGEEGLLVSPSRKMLFQRDKNDVHFWSFADSDKFGTLGQHIVIKNGSLKNISIPDDGILRFEVETKPFSIIRQELRAKRTDTFTNGLEWFGANSNTGLPIYEKAAWACNNPNTAASPCIGVADISLEKLFQSYMTSNDDDFEPLMTAERVGNRWIVKINISNVAADFDKRWEKVKSSDVNTRLSVILNYSKWGFHDEALEKYEQLMGNIDFVDTIIRRMLKKDFEKQQNY